MLFLPFSVIFFILTFISSCYPCTLFCCCTHVTCYSHFSFIIKLFETFQSSAILILLNIISCCLIVFHEILLSVIQFFTIMCSSSKSPHPRLHTFITYHQQVYFKISSSFGHSFSVTLDSTASYFFLFSLHKLFCIDFICLFFFKRFVDLFCLGLTYLFFLPKSQSSFDSFSENNFSTFFCFVTWASIHASFHDHVIHNFKFLVTLLIEFILLLLWLFVP